MLEEADFLFNTKRFKQWNELWNKHFWDEPFYQHFFYASTQDDCVLQTSFKPPISCWVTFFSHDPMSHMTPYISTTYLDCFLAWTQSRTGAFYEIDGLNQSLFYFSSSSFLFFTHYNNALMNFLACDFLVVLGYSWGKIPLSGIIKSVYMHLSR